jgi:hypothetical protein
MDHPSKTKGCLKHNYNNIFARSGVAIWILYMVRAFSNILNVKSLTAESFFNRRTGLYIWLAYSMGDFRNRRSDPLASRHGQLHARPQDSQYICALRHGFTDIIHGKSFRSSTMLSHSLTTESLLDG